jgi:pimeloyl-ACP methyl ester carboxylesterase
VSPPGPAGYTDRVVSAPGVPGVVHKSLASFDGTRIAYQVRGEGPAVVLANGLGGSYQAFRCVYDALGEGHKIVSWDYRGLYGSGCPRDLSTLALPFHCDDLERILDAERVDRALFIGWSMGVQVGFEFFRCRRERMAGIVAINGTAGLPFQTLLSSRAVRHVIPAAIAVARAQAALVGRATRAWVGWQGAVPIMQRLGLVSLTLDLETFRVVAEGFAGMDWKLYLDLLARLGEHDATDVLPEVDLPTLVITGDRDILTPPFTAERIHRAIPGSRLVVIPGGTHYTPVEYPALIKDELLDFLRQLERTGER